MFQLFSPLRGQKNPPPEPLSPFTPAPLKKSKILSPHEENLFDGKQLESNNEHTNDCSNTIIETPMKDILSTHENPDGSSSYESNNQETDDFQNTSEIHMEDIISNPHATPVGQDAYLTRLQNARSLHVPVIEDINFTSELPKVQLQVELQNDIYAIIKTASVVYQQELYIAHAGVFNYLTQGFLASKLFQTFDAFMMYKSTGRNNNIIQLPQDLARYLMANSVSSKSQFLDLLFPNLNIKHKRHYFTNQEKIYNAFGMDQLQGTHMTTDALHALTTLPDEKREYWISLARCQLVSASDILGTGKKQKDPGSFVDGSAQEEEEEKEEEEENNEEAYEPELTDDEIALKEEEESENESSEIKGARNIELPKQSKYAKDWPLNMQAGALHSVTLQLVKEAKVNPENATFQVQQVVEEDLRARVHPVINTPRIADNFIQGQSFAFVPGVDTLYGDDGKNMVFETSSRFLGAFIPGCNMTTEFHEYVDKQVLPVCEEMILQEKITPTDASKLSAGPVNAKLFCLIHADEKIANGDLAMKKNGTGVLIKGNPKQSKNYKNIEILASRVGSHLIDTPGKGSSMSKNEELFRKHPPAKDIIYTLAHHAHQMAKALSDLHPWLKASHGYMQKVGVRYPQNLLIPPKVQKELWGEDSELVYFTGSTQGFNLATANHRDKGNVPQSFSVTFYFQMAGIGGRLPATYFAYPLSYTALKISHCCVLLDRPDINLHASNGIIWQDSWRIMMNFYQHTPPEFWHEMYNIGYEIFFSYGATKQQQQAEQWAKANQQPLPTRPEPKVICFELVDTPEWKRPIKKGYKPVETLSSKLGASEEKVRFALFLEWVHKINRYHKLIADGESKQSAKGETDGNIYESAMCCEDRRCNYVMEKIVPQNMQNVPLRLRPAVADTEWTNFYAVLFQVLAWRLCVAESVFDQYYAATQQYFPKNLNEFKAFVTWIQVNKITTPVTSYHTPQLIYWVSIATAVDEKKEKLKAAARKGYYNLLEAITTITHIKNFHGSRILLDLIHYGFFSAIEEVHNNLIVLGVGAERGYRHLFNENPTSGKMLTNLKRLQKYMSDAEPNNIIMNLSDMEHALCEFQKMVNRKDKEATKSRTPASRKKKSSK